MTRPIHATVHLDALKNNLALVRRHAAHAKVWSVVKANGYGHRLHHIWPALGASDGFAMLNLEEAIALREAGWNRPILMLEGFFQAEELMLYDSYRLTTCVHSLWQVKALANVQLQAPLDVYLKINSGMNRLGFAPEQAVGLWHQLQALPAVGQVTLMTHFAAADSAHGVEEPMARLSAACAGIDAPRCFANSAATLWHPETQLDWVRPGIVLYGASPSGRWQDIAETGLRPAMALHSEIIAIQNLAPGDGVGYGLRFHANEQQRIGIVACGYADGYPRHAQDGTPVAVDGIRTRLVGAVSMDMLTVDLSRLPQAGIGSRVELWGEQIKVDDVAAASNTVGYELLSALAPRVPVRYG